MTALRVAIHAIYAVAERHELISLNVDGKQAARRAEGRMPRVIPPDKPLPHRGEADIQAIQLGTTQEGWQSG